MRALRTLHWRTMALLERTALLKQLHELLRGAMLGNGRLVCLAGEGGIGKSSITRTFVEDAASRARVLWGACEDLSIAEPLGALYELMVASSLTFRGDLHGAALFASVFDQLASAPSLVVLEDLHWADDATLDFVRYVGRRIERSPLLVLVTARDDTADAQSRLRRAIVNVPAAACVQMHVPALSKAATVELAATHQRDGEALYALTGGNPFLVTEALRSPGTIPDTVRQALLWRADRLSPAGRDAMEAAAIFPRRVETWLLEAMCAKTGDDGIGECVERGLLTSESGFYAFRHEIARQAIETSLLPLKKARLNKHALALLSERHPDASARLVHHAIEAHDVEAICMLAPRAAGEAADAGAHRQAAHHYKIALLHADACDASTRAGLYEKGAFELQLVGELHEAIRLFKAAHALHTARGDARGAGDALRWVSRLSYNIADRASADRFGAEAVATLEPLGDGPELAMAYANLALISALKDDSAGAISWADRTLALGARLGRKDILADAHGTLGVAWQWRDLAASRENFRVGLDYALALNRPELAARIYANASCIEFNTRHSEQAHAWLEAGLAYCRERDLEGHWVYMRGWLAELLLREGRWRDAGATARQVLDLPLVSPVLRFPASAASARLRFRTGDAAFAVALSDLTFEHEPQRQLVYAPILAERAWIEQTGEREALDLLKDASRIAADIGNVWAAGEIAYWSLRLGERPDPSLAVAAPFARQFAGDWEGAAALWAALPAPYEQALALWDGDDAARRRGLAILDQLGAIAVAARFRRDLRERGVRGIARGPRRSTRANAGGLTRREVEVLRLVDSGLGNAAIAGRLSLSVKTVDHHVSAILAKLGAGTRGEAASLARQHGILPAG